MRSVGDLLDRYRCSVQVQDTDSVLLQHRYGAAKVR